MIRPANSLIITACLFLSGFVFSFGELYADTSKGCSHRERYEDAGELCTDISPEDVIAIGSLRVGPNGLQGIKRVVLHDEEKGDIDLVLTPSLIQAVDESPAESYEVEGTLVNGQMVVKSLRPIE
ncbi:MAG: hypothetical protein EOP10_00885 [Proteobacteria bacterium]|nr:MAG: hypothetical protein EOP10_00885 [Pseudomonadota bacterium]